MCVWNTVLRICTIIFSVFDIPMKYLYGLDCSEEVSISLNLLPLVLKQTYASMCVV